MSGLKSLLVRSAVWWILRVVSPVAGVVYDLAYWLGSRLWFSHRYPVAEFLQMRLVPFVLLDFLAWPFAIDALRVKLAAEQQQEGGAE